MEIVEQNKNKLLLNQKLIKRFSGKRSLVLIAINNFEELSPFKIDKSEYGNMDEWLSVENIENEK